MDRCPALLIEAFSPGPLQGNGAAVVLLEQPATAAWMQGLANSLRQSETAFLWRSPDGPWALRWFTPSTEVPLCGHATLAATLGLHHWRLLQPGASLRLATRSGGLEVRVEEGPQPLVGLTLPGGGLIPEPQPPAYLQDLLGARPLAYWSSGLGYRVLSMPASFPLAALQLDTSKLQGADRQGLVLMQEASDDTPALGNQPCDYQLRFFAPGLGIEIGRAHV